MSAPVWGRAELRGIGATQLLDVGAEEALDLGVEVALAGMSDIHLAHRCAQEAEGAEHVDGAGRVPTPPIFKDLGLVLTTPTP